MDWWTAGFGVLCFAAGWFGSRSYHLWRIASLEQAIQDVSDQLEQIVKQAQKRVEKRQDDAI